MVIDNRTKVTVNKRNIVYGNMLLKQNYTWKIAVGEWIYIFVVKILNITVSRGFIERGCCYYFKKTL